MSRAARAPRRQKQGRGQDRRGGSAGGVEEPHWEDALPVPTGAARRDARVTGGEPLGSEPPEA